MDDSSEHRIKGTTINNNTYVSVAVLVTVLSGFGIVLSTIYGAKSEISINQNRFETKVDALKDRVDKFELAKESWSYQDMFKWAVHLQRDNPNLKVPEPENKNP